MPDSVLAFIFAFISTVALTPVVIWLCTRFTLNADPNPIIVTHKVAKPTLGGVAIYFSFMAALAVVMIQTNQISFFTKLLAGTMPIFLMGIYDDLKGLGFKFKGLVEIVLVTGFILVFKLNPGFDVHPVFDYFLMVLWFVGITNAINLIDIMDGLASGIGFFVSLAFFSLAVLMNRPELIPIAAALTGCYLAFLYYNFNPAKIFLGDNGSLVMGLALAYLGFELFGHDPISVKVMAPVIILAIPIFEVFLLVLRRMKKKIGVFEGSPDHLALVIQSFGNSIQKTAVIIYFVSAILVVLGILVAMSSLAVQLTISILVVVVAVLLLGFMRNVEVK